MLGLSTSWGAHNDLDIYSSIAKSYDMGFKLVELGAAHKYEKDVFKTMKRVSRDFSSLKFTVHCYFPPVFKMPYYFNISDGLNLRTRKVIQALFRIARIVNAEVIGLHCGKKYEVKCKRVGGRIIFYKGDLIKNSIEKMGDVLKLCDRIGREYGVRIAVENGVKRDNVILNSPLDFKSFIDGFENVGLLLDTQHAVKSSIPFKDFLSFKNKIFEVHLNGSDGGEFDVPVYKDKSCVLELLNNKYVRAVPIIFERGSEVRADEILKEKNVVEDLLKNV